jgi:hypothetical protein
LLKESYNGVDTAEMIVERRPEGSNHNARSFAKTQSVENPSTPIVLRQSGVRHTVDKPQIVMLGEGAQIHNATRFTTCQTVITKKCINIRTDDVQSVGGQKLNKETVE